MSLKSITEDLINLNISENCLNDIIAIVEDELHDKKAKRRYIDKNIKQVMKVQRKLNSAENNKNLKDDYFDSWTDDNLFIPKIKAAMKLSGLLKKKNALVSDIKTLANAKYK